MISINKLGQIALKNAKEHGFYDDDPNPNPITKLMLIVEELGEACSAIRNNRYCTKEGAYKYISNMTNNIHIDLDTDNLDCICTNQLFSKKSLIQVREVWISEFQKRIKDTFEDELADAAIRIFELAAYHDIDLDSHILSKMYYNTTRPYKHGKTC